MALKPLILSLRIERERDKTAVIAEFGIRQVKREISSNDKLVRVSAIFDDQGELVDLETICIKE